MPQMAPLSWIILFIFFCVMFFIFNTLNYFCFFNFKNNVFIESNSNNDQLNNLYWKW